MGQCIDLLYRPASVLTVLPDNSVALPLIIWADQLSVMLSASTVAETASQYGLDIATTMWGAYVN